MPSNVTGFTINGSINFELSKFPALEEAMAGVLASNWGQCPLTGAPANTVDAASRIVVGQTLKTFTIEKRFPRLDSVPGALNTVAVTGVGGTTGITVTPAGTSVGSGVMRIEVGVAGKPPHSWEVLIPAGSDPATAATAIVNSIGAPGNGSGWAAVATGADVDITVDPAPGVAPTYDVGTATVSTDKYIYQRFTGCTYSALSLSVSPNSPVTGSVTVVGGTPTLSNTPLPGATYQSAGTNPVFTAPEVMALSIGTALGLSKNCWTSLTINLDSQNRGIPCIGSKGDREVVLGSLSASVSGDVYFSDQTILEYILNNQTMGDSEIILSNGNDVYRFDFFQMKPISGRVAAGGPGQDMVIPVEFQPAPVPVCSTAQEKWNSSVLISTVATAPARMPVP
jgi:hypothetical protein